jgi:hypothetical protein
MLPIGGVVVFDDADWPSIRRVIRFALTNLPYCLYRTLPEDRIVRSSRRKAYEGFACATSIILNALRRIPGLEKPIARAFGAELLGTDTKLGLKGSMVALQKVGNDERPQTMHAEFF